MLIAVVIIATMLTTSCSVFKKVVYYPDINQGNYLTVNDINKIRIGMSKQQVSYVLGTSIIKDPFGSNTWYYIFRYKPGHKSATQQTIILTFNKNGILTNIDNKLTLENENIIQ